MSWSIYQEVVSTYEERGARAALKLIDDREAEIEENFSPILVLQASYESQLGLNEEAANRLLRVLKNDPGEYWANYNLTFVLYALGRRKEAQHYLHQAHSAIGWTESGKNGYEITHDYFSPNIFQWRDWFSDLIGKPSISFLEIGSWQGGSAAWLLDKVLTAEDASITCIDTFEGSSEHTGFVGKLPLTLEQLFDSNMRRTGSSSKVTKLKGYSQDVLRSVTGSYDLIYVDGAHEAKYVAQDAFLSWPLVKKGGLMLFDDYTFAFAESPNQNTARAVDFFLDVMEDELEIVAKARQVLMRKL